MPYLTTTEQIIAALMVAAFIGVLLYLNWRAGRLPIPFRSFALQGPAIPNELQQVLGAYGTSPITGLIVLQDGIRVWFEDGTSTQFMPVPHEGVLCVDENGQFVVRMPGEAKP